MKLLKISFIITLFLLFINDLNAQSGGRKREHKNQSKGSIFKRHRSSGHADKFASGNGRKGLFARLFRKDRPAWVYHSTKSGRAQVRETRNLFTRFRTKGRVYREGILAKQNTERAKRRSRGNSSFHHKRYF
ncbi:MAG: hypothetical protein JSU07_09390 [Bacteroidetes bacterium]|nr:hypothetical protein [Bacteroidota bacterium]